MMSLNTNKQLIGFSHPVKVAIRIGVKLAPLLILTLCGFMYEQLFHAHPCTGLVEEPLDPRYIPGSEVGLLFDDAYFGLMETVSVISTLSFLPSFFIAVKICLKKQQSEVSKLLLALLVLIGIPLVVHTLGTGAVTALDESGGAHRVSQIEKT